MPIIYENTVKALGSQVNSFAGADFIILFGDSAPAELKDYCYSVDVNPIQGDIKPGQILCFDDQAYMITAVGSEAPVTLKGLGHCTVRFSGDTTAEMAGTIYVEKKSMPTITAGTKIQIVDPKVVYENEVKALGSQVNSFAGADFIILFGDSAPAELKDFCYSVDVNPINGDIKPGQILMFGDQSYTITAVGTEAPVTLRGLGHCTIRFNGDTTAEMAGTIYVEKKDMPTITAGTKIQIVEMDESKEASGPVYKNVVKALGSQVKSFAGADFIILFGDSAPAELKDYCYSVDVNPINGDIKPGQILSFGDQAYTITAVGSEAPVTLKGLGHCTVRFSGDTTAEMAGTIYVEKKAMPTIEVGTEIEIREPKIIYDNTVKSLGSQVKSFAGADFIILFGDSAPAELKDYCYSIDVNPINGDIKPGQILKFDDQAYTITAVGSEAPVTLKGLGHCTVRFSGDTTAEMAGTIYVEKKEMPKIGVNTHIQIIG
ncbi:MAG: PTS glucitol/sorbitol transporter subunit IIA [Erysipelotrichaceae bacterium]|nr:PTS glucitol/sorbitol transporter subunit IIA [Erysipelotrichaceae bacterium]